ncbi:AAA family ATPase [Synechococcus sp. BO 8801]|uniref:AAA family ATPase n=1 Tax=Synechococcus sp. BO 8801 TaxID=169670 RepID=UPI00117FB37C|nr:AAA family ATPase [Synechococcus sp. BO 8801]
MYRPFVVGYTQEIAEIWAALSSGRDVALHGPRGSGKTTLLYRIRDGAAERRFAAAFINAGVARNPSEFVSGLYKAAKAIPSAEVAIKEATRKLKSGLAGIAAVEVSLSGLKLEFDKEAKGRQEGDWKVAGEVLLSSLESLKSNTVIIVDDFDCFLESLEQSALPEFLSWFRAMCEIGRQSNSASWLFTSNHRLHQYVLEHSSRNALHDLYYVELRPFDESTAGDFLYTALASSGLEVQEDDRLYAIKRLGTTYPYFLQAFAHTLSRIAPTGANIVTRADIDAVFERLALDTSTFIPRITAIVSSQVGPQYSDATMQILKEISKSETGLTKEQVDKLLKSELGSKAPKRAAAAVLSTLVAEHILSKQDDRFTVAIGPLRESLRGDA